VEGGLDVLTALDRACELRLKKNRELFYLVYHAVGEASPRLLTFNAHYGLFVPGVVRKPSD
jgi:hypothetical protein